MPATTVEIHAPAAAPIDYARIADAIRQVETGRNVRQGANGELGPWQFTEAAWREDANGLDFAYVTDRGTARGVAIRRLRRLAALLRERRIEPTVYRLAVAWNAGISAVILSKWVNQPVRDYAQRVTNLVNERTPSI